ncbi:hypothetical protein OG741_01300 [Streptomyces sp. NBC_01410]|uniref:hypothetical protein n=1 Tax=Streptomyces sp. NBC_01410 TaxID=2903856 RepID=UPI0032506733
MFVDWTSRNDERTEATGTLGGASVTLAGPLGAAYLQEDWTEFGLAYFTPPLPASDMIEMVGLFEGSALEVSFRPPVKNPVFHLGSLASELEFLELPSGTRLDRLSGDDHFEVDGNKVKGQFADPVPNPDGSLGPSDSNGSVRLRGREPVSSIRFTLKPTYSGGSPDGVHLQIGGTVEQPVFVDWTSRNDERTTAEGTLDRRTSVTLAGPLGAAYLQEDWTEFGLAYFTPPLPASDMIEMVGLFEGSALEVSFRPPVKNPVFHLGSLASELEFLELPSGTRVERLSGDDHFEVDGNKVKGQFADPVPNPDGSLGPSDSNGSVRLRGREPVSSIRFTLKPTYTAGSPDGVHLQIGGTPLPNTSPTETATA